MKLTWSYKMVPMMKTPARIGDDLIGPPEFTFKWSRDGSPDDIAANVEGRVEFIEGTYQCVELSASGRVTSEALHKVPVQELVRTAMLGVVMEIKGKDAEKGSMSIGFVGFDPKVADQGPTSEAIVAVAKIYRLAYAAGDPPTKSVAEALGLAPSTASRWIRKARDEGLLGRTQRKGKAGV